MTMAGGGSGDGIGMPDRRRHPRFATEFVADLVQKGLRRRVMVGDISAGGAMLGDEGGLAVGEWIRLEARDFSVEARVTWVQNGVCGVRFPDAVDPAEVVAANAPSPQTLWSRMKDLHQP